MLRGLIAVVAALAFGASAAAQEFDNNTRMAETIARVCAAGLRTGEPITVEQFDGLLVFDHERRGVTWLKHARGQPWVHVAINGARPGSCGVNFTSSARNSMTAARALADLIARMPGLRRVSVPGMNAAFTFAATPEPFVYERDASITYVAVAGYQNFIFMPAPPEQR